MEAQQRRQLVLVFQRVEPAAKGQHAVRHRPPGQVRARRSDEVFEDGGWRHVRRLERVSGRRVGRFTAQDGHRDAQVRRRRRRWQQGRTRRQERRPRREAQLRTRQGRAVQRHPQGARSALHRQDRVDDQRARDLDGRRRQAGGRWHAQARQRAVVLGRQGERIDAVRDALPVAQGQGRQGRQVVRQVLARPHRCDRSGQDGDAKIDQCAGPRPVAQR